MAQHGDRGRDMRQTSWNAGVPDGPTVGDLLRQRREELRYDLAGVATSLRIRRLYLQAIEDGNYADLPGQAYILGFLRSYAEILGLDAADIVERFKAETGGQVNAAELYMPIPVNENRVPGGVMLIIAGVLAVALYGGWYVYTGHTHAPVEEVAKVPDRLAHSVATPDQPAPAGVLPAPAVQALLSQAQPTAPEVGVSADQPGAVPAMADALAAPQPLPSAAPAATGATPAPAASTTAPAAALGKAAPAAPSATAESGEDQATLPADLAALPPPAPTAAQAQAQAQADAADKPTITAPAGTDPATQAPRTGRVFGVAGGPARVVVRAVEDSWIQVRDGKGTVWASRVLHPGDTFRAPDVAGLTLETGNAGGLVVSLDGRDLPPLGDKSQVRRGVPLAPESLGAAKTPAPTPTSGERP